MSRKSYSHLSSRESPIITHLYLNFNLPLRSEGHVLGRPYSVHEYTIVSPCLPKTVFSCPPPCLHNSAKRPKIQCYKGHFYVPEPFKLPNSCPPNFGLWASLDTGRAGALKTESITGE